MRWMRGFLSFFMQNKNNIDDMKEVTNFLKDNQLFRKTAFFIHDTKNSVKDRLKNTVDEMLQNEDNLKFIEDDKKNKEPKNNKK